MNPYEVPLLDEYLEPPPFWPEEAREHLRLPAYGLLWTGCGGVILAIVLILAALFAPSEADKALVSPAVDRTMTLLAGALLIGLQAAIAYSGWALLHLRSYHEARWVVLFTVVSLGGALLVAFPFGLWAFLCLCDTRVRGAFVQA